MVNQLAHKLSVFEIPDCRGYVELITRCIDVNTGYDMNNSNAITAEYHFYFIIQRARSRTASVKKTHWRRFWICRQRLIPILYFSAMGNRDRQSTLQAKPQALLVGRENNDKKIAAGSINMMNRLVLRRPWLKRCWFFFQCRLNVWWLDYTFVL